MNIIIGIFWGVLFLLLMSIMLLNSIQDFYLKQKLKKRLGHHFLNECKTKSCFPLLCSNNAKAWDYELAENEKFLNGITLLHVAAAVGNKSACEVLLYFKADPLCPDRQGRTPIDYANQAAHADIVKLLEKHIAK